MTRHHGRNGSVYMGVWSTSLPSPCAFQSAWTLNKTVAKQDVTAFGDGNMVYVSGIPDSSGDFSGFWDDQTAQTYNAATDGLPRNFYLYPDLQNSPTVYWFGQMLPDFSTDGAIAGAINFKSTWNAAAKVWLNNPALSATPI